MILAGDVGGTKCNLAFYSFTNGIPEVCFEKSYPSEDFSGLEAVSAAFLSDSRDLFSSTGPSIEAACFGIAGPVVNQKVSTTNLPWEISASSLSEALEIGRVFLLNDLEATGYGVLSLGDEQFLTLNPGKTDPGGQAALIAAGTGLGEGFFVSFSGRTLPFPSEGGHSSFSPCSSLEVSLLEYLEKKYGHVSSERVLSGPGLLNIYNFLRDTKRAEEPPVFADDLAKAVDPSAYISSRAMENSPEIAVKALDIFTAVYGSAAANLALKVKATAGVYVGGGIAPKIIPFMKKGLFMESFLAKGRMRGLLEDMPVKVVLEPKAALLGAACYGTRACKENRVAGNLESDQSTE